MKNLKRGDTISLDVPTEFNVHVHVEFKIVHVLDYNKFAAIAQDRLVVILRLPNDTFKMSKAIDLLDVAIIDSKICCESLPF